MMKNLIKLFGIIALVAVIGFALMGCDTEPDDPGPTDKFIGSEANPVSLTVGRWSEVYELPTEGSAGWFSFPVSSGTTYHIWVREYSTSGVTLADGYALVWTTAKYQSGAVIFEKSGAGTNSTTTATASFPASNFQADQNGTVVVKVFPDDFWKTFGKFSIAVTTAHTRLVWPNPALPAGKTITVTGLSSYNNNYGYVALASSGPTVVAVSLPKQITGGSLIMDLLDPTDETPFTGSGTYAVVFEILTSASDLYSDIYSGTISSKAITAQNTNIAFTDFPPVVSTYIITETTASAGTFKALKGTTTVSTGETIQNVINAIRGDAAGTAVTIQFGNLTDVLNVGDGSGSGVSINFVNATPSTTAGNVWGAITLTGKISGTPVSSGYLLNINSSNMTVSSSADITAVTRSAIRNNGENATLTITGGTITATSSDGVVGNYGTTTIQSGVIINASTAVACAATVNITGGTITGSTNGVTVVNTGNRLNVSGSPVISATGASGRGIYINTGGGAVTLADTPTITSVNTSDTGGTIHISTGNTNNPVLTIGADVTITNTAETGPKNTIYNPGSLPVVDNRS